MSPGAFDLALLNLVREARLVRCIEHLCEDRFRLEDRLSGVEGEFVDGRAGGADLDEEIAFDLRYLRFIKAMHLRRLGDVDVEPHLGGGREQPDQLFGGLGDHLFLRFLMDFMAGRAGGAAKPEGDFA